MVTHAQRQNTPVYAVPFFGALAPLTQHTCPRALACNKISPCPGLTKPFTKKTVACFDGGNFILGGLTLNEPSYIDFGLELVAGCRETYTQTATKIGPESFRWLGENSPANATAPPGNETFYERAGFWIDSANYVLRPEVIESYYYAYRATGDTKYQDWAWEAYLAINETCRVGSGYSAINDVNVPGGGGFADFQESFWFAEVLKYSYLIHAEVSFNPFSFQPVGYRASRPADV